MKKYVGVIVGATLLSVGLVGCSTVDVYDDGTVTTSVMAGSPFWDYGDNMDWPGYWGGGYWGTDYGHYNWSGWHGGGYWHGGNHWGHWHHR